MAELVADCPRCGARRVTFDLTSYTRVGFEYGWQSWYEGFCVCRHCRRSTIFVLSEKGTDEAKMIKEAGLLKTSVTANNLLEIEEYISQKNAAATPPPAHLPTGIKAAFNEGATCLAVCGGNYVSALY